MESTGDGQSCSSADGMLDISGRSCSSLNGRYETRSRRSTMAGRKKGMVSTPAAEATETTISSDEKDIGMTKTRSMNRNQNHDDASSSTKMFKIFDKGGVAPWLDVDHDVLFLVMMKLGFIDFFAFSGVCKSWRSFALTHASKFMASKPPMSVCIEPRVYNHDIYSYCYLNDFQGRRFKTILPHFTGRACIGVTCGYLILFGRKARDFSLVNPITRHELHFPDCPLCLAASRDIFKGILVFLPSLSGWVFVLLHKKIIFSLAGKQRWNHVTSTLPIFDLHFFKVKIYTLHKDCSLSQLIIHPNQKRKYTLLKTKVFPNPESSDPRLVSSGENLFVVNRYPSPRKRKIPELDFGEIKWVSPGMELDFGEMKWVSLEKKIEEYAFFVSLLNYSAAIKKKSLVSPRTNHKSYVCFLDEDKS